MSSLGRIIVGAAALVASVVSLAAAQSPPTRLRGSIAALDGNTVTIATREGTSVPVKLADNWSVMLVSPMTLADIKQNSFVGIASIKGPDGSLNALEVLIFPEASRGSNEGHYPWDLRPDAKPGAKVFLGATRGADGGLAAGRLLVGKDGLTPPM